MRGEDRDDETDQAASNYPREEVVLLWHDTKEEHADTYRFLRQMSETLGVPITERSDGRSVTEVFRDEGYLGNNRNAMCSRILKAEQGSRFVRELREEGFAVYKVIGYSAREPDRVQRMVGYGLAEGFTPIFPIIKERVSKQECADWCAAQGVCPSAMYLWAEHANCVGCVKGGRAYWLKVAEHAPDIRTATSQGRGRPRREPRREKSRRCAPAALPPGPRT